MNATAKSKPTTRSFTNCVLVRLTAATAFILCLTALWLAGCLTETQMIGQRIKQKSVYFATLPAENQQRLREGKLKAGDTRDAAWIVYGKPDRVTTTATNEVWSYMAPNPASMNSPNQAYFPTTGAGGRVFTNPEAPLTSRTPFDTYEYLRIRFEGDHVLSIEHPVQP